jgi:hypothetical protein
MRKIKSALNKSVRIYFFDHCSQNDAEDTQPIECIVEGELVAITQKSFKVRSWGVLNMNQPHDNDEFYIILRSTVHAVEVLKTAWTWKK